MTPMFSSLCGQPCFQARESFRFPLRVAPAPESQHGEPNSRTVTAPSAGLGTVPDFSFAVSTNAIVRFESLPEMNPCGGMPMVVLCGQNVAKKIVAWDR